MNVQTFSSLRTFDQYWVNKARQALTPENLDSWIKGLKGSIDISGQITGYLSPTLVNAYITVLNQKLGVFDKYIKNRPFLEIRFNSYGDVDSVALSPEAAVKAKKQLYNYVKTFVEQEEVYTSFVKWFWRQSVNRTLALMDKNLGLNTQYRMSDRDWAITYSKILCHADNKYLLNMCDTYSRHLSELLAASLMQQSTSLSFIEDLLGLKSYQICIPITPQTGSNPDQEKYLTSFSMAFYQQVRKVIPAGNLFTAEETRWPEAKLKTASGRTYGVAAVKPDNMTRQQAMDILQEMNDETVDVLDALCHLWLKNAVRPDDLVLVSADELLALRGLKKQKNGQGKRGGYKKEWRERIAKHIFILNNLWITTSLAGQVTTDGLIILENRTTADSEYHWLYRPGKMLAKHLQGSKRQTALLAEKVLRLDPYRKAYEKRTARYFSWLWRIKQGKGMYLEPIRVKTVLDSISINYEKGHPAQIMERFDKIMDTLHEVGIINGWQYDASYGNWREWLDGKVIVEPPELVMNHYENIKPPGKQSSSGSSLKKADNMAALISQELKAERKRRKMTQMQVAEEIGINQTTISKLENRRQKPDHNTYQKIKKWLTHSRNLPSQDYCLPNE